MQGYTRSGQGHDRRLNCNNRLHVGPAGPNLMRFTMTNNVVK